MRRGLTQLERQICRVVEQEPGHSPHRLALLIATESTGWSTDHVLVVIQELILQHVLKANPPGWKRYGHTYRRPRVTLTLEGWVKLKKEEHDK